jgi:hypothetical protein
MNHETVAENAAKSNAAQAQRQTAIAVVDACLFAATGPQCHRMLSR